MHFVRWALAAVAAFAMAQAPARAQDYPSRPITILVGLAPGGVTDVMARLYAQKVGDILKQTVVVENRPAASGAVAAAALQKAAPDGYMLLLFSGAQHATVPALTDNAIYDPVKGAQPVAVVFNFTGVVAVPADSPANSVADLVALAKTKPQGLNFGSPGPGTPSHLAGADRGDRRQGGVHPLQGRLAHDDRSGRRPARRRLAERAVGQDLPREQED